MFAGALDYFSGEDALEVLRVGAFVSEIAESLPPSYRFDCPLHRNISLNLFNRSQIKSISRCGVLTPGSIFSEMHAPPRLIGDLYRVDQAKCVAFDCSAISNTPSLNHATVLRVGLGALGRDGQPARQIDLAPSGKVSNSLSTALNHGTGRVVLVIRSADIMLSGLTTLGKDKFVCAAVLRFVTSRHA